jgi:peptide methionine sulfoxide reductase msrA/msrB
MSDATETAIFASGCFWGVQYHFNRADGVISTKVGYIGGQVMNPTYKQVCSGTTGHAEAIEVVFDPSQVSYRELAVLFFETHDPTQVNHQGPDFGTQYRTEIFYLSDEQKAVAEELIGILTGKGLAVATKVTPAETFWSAEDYHQDYYAKTGKSPYCHIYTKRF